MRLTLTRHGGFAGLRRPPLMIDTARCAPAVASELERLAHAAKTGGTSVAPPSAAMPQPDRFGYTLTIGREGESETTLAFDETSSNPAHGALVQAIQNAATAEA